MRLKAILILSLFGLLSLGATGAVPTVKLYTKNGEVLGPIYFPRNGEALEIEAAHELGEFLSEIFATDWPVEPESSRAEIGIFVGQTERAAEQGISVSLEGDFHGLRELESLRIAVRKERVFLVGGSPHATGFAVSRFLQDFFGVRWFFPGQLGRFVPRLEEIEIATFDKTIEPSFWKRQIGYSEEAKDWRRFNGSSMRGWTFNHALHRFATPKLFANHPEFFPLIGDARQLVSPKRNQPNLAEPSFARYVARILAEGFERNSDWQGRSISTTDSRRFDESELTASFMEPVSFFRGHPDASSLVFTFSNRVAEALFGILDRQNDGRFLVALAYMWAEKAPPLEIHPRLIPMLTYDRAQWFDQELKREDETNTVKWSNSGASFLAIWDYHFGYPYIVPRHVPSIYSESIPFLHRNDARIYFSDTISLWSYDALENWLTMQLLWDVEADADALQDEFFQKMYGNAAAPMRAFFDLLENIWMDQPRPGFWLKYFVSPDQFALLDESTCKKLDSLLQEAFAAAKRPREVERIELVAGAWKFTKAGYLYYNNWSLLASESLSSKASQERFRALMASEQALAEKWLSLAPLVDYIYRIDIRAILLALQSEERLSLARAVADQIPVRSVNGNQFGEISVDRWYIEDFQADGWRLSVLPAENLSIQTKENDLSFKNVSEARLFTWCQVSDSRSWVARAHLSGEKMPGARVELYMQFYDEKRNRLGRVKMDALPADVFEDAIPLFVGEVPPVGSEWVQIGLAIRHQMEGELTLEGLEIFQLSALR